MIARTYAMTAADGRGDDLHAALSTLAGQVRSLAGALRVDILRDQKSAAVFLFVETWESADAAAKGGKALGREAFAPIMVALADPPVTAQYDVT